MGRNEEARGWVMVLLTHTHESKRTNVPTPIQVKKLNEANPERHQRTCLTSTSLWACIPCRISDTDSRCPLREARYSLTCR